MTTTSAKPHLGRCPKCNEPTLLDAANRFRPFCSERCKLLDLGAWMDGRYAIPTAQDEPDGEDEIDDGEPPRRLQ